MGDSSIPSWVRSAVLMRDGYRCMAPVLDRNAGWCRDVWGHLITRWPHRDPGPEKLQLHHVKDADKPMMGKKAPSDASHLIPICPGHHFPSEGGSCWATKRESLALVRAHLERVT